MYPTSDMEKLSNEQLLHQPYDPPPPYNTWQPSAPPSTAAQQPIAFVSPTVTVVVDDGKFGPYPKNMKCYHCGEQIATTIDRKAGAITWILCTALCIVGCFCGCCLIPFCASSTQDIMHKCPKCKKFLGAYERCKFRR